MIFVCLSKSPAAFSQLCLSVPSAACSSDYQHASTKNGAAKTHMFGSQLTARVDSYNHTFLRFSWTWGWLLCSSLPTELHRGGEQTNVPFKQNKRCVCESAQRVQIAFNTYSVISAHASTSYCKHDPCFIFFTESKETLKPVSVPPPFMARDME